ncbi:MAG: hypothetical protein AAF456_25885 [Planctomycetota bacterium]
MLQKSKAVLVVLMFVASGQLYAQDVTTSHPATVIGSPVIGSSVSSADCGSCGEAVAVSGQGHRFSGLGTCGTPGRLFNQCGEQQCCGCEKSSCGCGSGRGNGRLSNLISMLPSMEVTFDCNPCPQRYVSFFGGGVYTEEYQGEVAPNLFTGSFNDGFVVGVARGQYLNSQTRIEAETSWRNNSGKDWFNPFGGVTNFDGRLNNFSSMVNIVRESTPQGRVGFYRGAGIGVSRQDGEFVVGADNYEIDDWAFAYQGFAGISLRDRPDRSLYAEYRYMGNTTTDLELNGAFFDSFVYSSHNLIFGIQIMR